MSDEISEFRRKLDEIHDLAIATDTNVTWIKAGMVETKDQMAKTNDRVTKLEKHQNIRTGFYAAIGTLSGLLGGHFLKGSGS